MKSDHGVHCTIHTSALTETFQKYCLEQGFPGVLPYLSHIGVFRPEEYGFWSFFV